MEAAPLTLAHTHARNAVFETRKSNPVAASEEHDLAAGEFASAAQKASSQEALRTLKLLEDHHKKLAEILRFQHEHPEPSTATLPPNTASAAPDAAKTKTHTGQEALGQPPRLPEHPRLPSRESSSIASNLATARGIPAQPRRGSPVSPTLTAQQAGAKMTENRAKTGESRLRETPRGNRSGRAAPSRNSWAPPLSSPTDVTSQQVVPSETAAATQKPVADEGFQRFYSTIEGLMSKLSAPLAFAGIPLRTDDSGKAGYGSHKSGAEAKLDRKHATQDRGTAEPDVNKLFSQAALRSLRDSQGYYPGNPAESFYVVPTTGGTMSYAQVLSRAEKEARRNSIDDGDDDFVDARESPSNSPEMRQTSSISRTARRGTTDKQMSVRLEELEMENKYLKQASDTLSKRLHMWEVNAQSSSMALQQSLRAFHHQHPSSPEQTLRGPQANISPVATMTTPSRQSDLDPTIKELQEEIENMKKQLERSGTENQNLKGQLGKMQNRWDKLMRDAKNRRESRAKERQSDQPTPSSSSKATETTTPQPDTDSSDKSTARGSLKGSD